MAKGSAMGLWKGKKGSSVFYQIKNTNSMQKQGIRERNYEPSNPQSARQASQRMRMYPAQAVYNVLKDTIERSWQGVKYGQMTRQAYLKSALRSEFFPAVSKSDNVVVPGPYQIAKGSLNEIKTNLSEDGSASFDINMQSRPEDDTVASLSTTILSDNPWLQEGDQLTFVICYNPRQVGVRFNWIVVSFYLNTTDQTVYNELVFPYGFNWIIVPGDFALQTDSLGDNYVYAAACIVSREGTTPLRSNATLAVNAAALPDYYGTAARAKAQRSYMKALTVQSTDWPVDPGTEGGGGDDTLTYTVSQVTLDEEGQESTTVGGTVSGGGSYLPGETVSLIATPATNYLFQGWFPSKADALANTNRISANAVYAFAAGDEVFTSRTIIGKFAHEL